MLGRIVPVEISAFGPNSLAGVIPLRNDALFTMALALPVPTDSGRRAPYDRLSERE